MEKVHNIKLKPLQYQADLIRSKAPYRALIGGTGCGKTFILPTILLIEMVKRPGLEWIVSSPTSGDLKKGPIKYCTKFFDKHKIHYQLNKVDMTMSLDLGMIYFVSAETPDRMQGNHVGGIIGDEAGNYSKLWWDTAVQRTTFHKGAFILLLTTPYALNWLKTEFYDKFMAGDEDFFVAQVDIHDDNGKPTGKKRLPYSMDNPHYPEEGIIRAHKTLPDWKFRMMYCAEFRRPAGLVFEEYTTCKPFAIPDDWYKNIGLDFGVNHPYGIIWVAKDPDTEVTYAYREKRESGKTANDMYDEIIKDEATCYADPAGKGEILILQNLGLDVRTARKERGAGAGALQAAFKLGYEPGGLIVFEDMVNLIDELGTYHYLADKNGDLTDEMCKTNDDLIDPLRYVYFTTLVEFDGIEMCCA